MDKSDKENKAVSSDSYRGSSGEKPKIKPHPKITPKPKKNGREGESPEKQKEDTNGYILEKLKDFEKEEEERKAAKSAEEQKHKIAEEVRQMGAIAENIYGGIGEHAGTSQADKIKAMYDFFKSIAKTNYDELNMLVKYDLECEQHAKLLDVVLSDVNREENTIHKLKIIIRDLQDKTPKIHSEVQNFVDSQKKWREEKEEEFRKSIATIKSQMSPASEDTGENEMMTKYNELCNYVETMRKEVDGFKEAREKLITDRDEKIKELEDTKNTKLADSKNNIEEKIRTLKTESDRLKKELPASRKDYSTHKKESKKLLTIIEHNNKKKKDLKDLITKLIQELGSTKNKNKDHQSLVSALSSKIQEQEQNHENLKKELAEITEECKNLQEQIAKNKQ